MGFEYRFTIGKPELERLARCPAGPRTLDEILRALPGFLHTDGGQYFFRPSPAPEKYWPCSACIDECGILLCIYDRHPNSFGTNLLGGLKHELQNRCGRIEIEEL